MKILENLLLNKVKADSIDLSKKQIKQIRKQLKKLYIIVDEIGKN